MKVQKIIKKMHQAIFEHDVKKEKKMWLKALKKSINHKNTHVIK
jgi:hypothetical protein